MSRTATAIYLAAVTVWAVAGARPYAGAWNDGSRLAAVESLADRGTFVIDDSIFVRVPAGPPHPYTDAWPALRVTGTADKLFINGHFYSDKSPVPSVLLAGVYRAYRAAGGPSAAADPAGFCVLMTVAGAGLPAVLAAWGVVVLGRVLGLTGHVHAVYAVSFVASTVVPAYMRQVNAHVALLGPAVWLCVLLATATARGRLSAAAGVGVGTLAGVGYTLDLAVGPALWVILIPLVAVTFRSAAGVGWVLVGGLPWAAAHHALNYQVAGTLLPANAVLEYLTWPGSPFDAASATGGLKHTPPGAAGYALDLLFGRRGFLPHNPPTLLAVAGAVRLVATRPADRPAAAFCLAWPALAVGLYAATSSNWSGQNVSVRWFVPLLAPAYWALGLTLRAYPWTAADLRWLAAVGLVPAGLMAADGPWDRTQAPLWWLWAALAWAGWLAVELGRRRAARRATTPSSSAA